MSSKWTHQWSPTAIFYTHHGSYSLCPHGAFNLDLTASIHSCDIYWDVIYNVQLNVISAVHEHKVPYQGTRHLAQRAYSESCTSSPAYTGTTIPCLKQPGGQCQDTTVALNPMACTFESIRSHWLPSNILVDTGNELGTTQPATAQSSTSCPCPALLLPPAL